MIFKYALFFILISGSSSFFGMLSPAVQSQVDAFNEWKKKPGKTPPVFLLDEGADGTDANSVAIYTNLTILAGNIPDKMMEGKVNEATQFAQQVCPIYEYWPEFFHLMRKKKDGKGYSIQKDIKLALKPLIKKINQYRLVVAVLSRDEKTPKRELLDTAQEEQKLKAALKPGEKLNQLTIISKLVPERKAELQRLQKEYEAAAKPESVCEVVYEAVKGVEKKQEKNAVLKYDLRRLQAEHEQIVKSRERMRTLLAVCESSQDSNWQSIFAELVKKELIE